MHAPPPSDTRPIRAVYVHGKQHGALLWEGWRRVWIYSDGPPILFHRNADRLSIRAAIAMRLGVPTSAVELRASPAQARGN